MTPTLDFRHLSHMKSSAELQAEYRQHDLERQLELLQRENASLKEGERLARLESMEQARAAEQFRSQHGHSTMVARMDRGVGTGAAEIAVPEHDYTEVDGRDDMNSELEVRLQTWLASGCH